MSALLLASLLSATPPDLRPVERPITGPEERLHLLDPVDDGSGGEGPYHPKRSVWSLGATLIPGLLLHGSGHFVGDDASTAGKLLAAELAGGVVALAGGLPVYLTGASRRFSGLGGEMVLIGTALFGATFVADVYGVAMHQTDRGEPLPTDAVLTADLAYRYVYDPDEAHRHFVVPAVSLKWWRFGMTGEWWWAPGKGSNQERVEGRFRLLGRTPGQRDRDGSYLDAMVAVTRHEVGGVGAHSWTGEAQLQSRLDGERVSRSLEGLFGELSVGMGTQVISYDAAGLPYEDTPDLLLLRAAVGMYLGHPWGLQGEFSVYYDQRHDTFTGGLVRTDMFSGIWGPIGAQGALQLTESVGVTAMVEFGTAVTAGAGVRFRYGGLTE